MKPNYYFSIVMASYNSENTIEIALASIRSQKFNQDEIEILVVDGGSTDNTPAIAKKYEATVLENPYRLPEAAKMIGLKYATGKYLCIMDSDEKVADDRIFERRKNLLESHKELKCLAIGLQTPVRSDVCCHYINMVGDPFTCFVYKTFKDGMEGLIIKKGKYHPNLESYIARYNKEDIKPIGDSGVVMDLNYLKEHYEAGFGHVITATLFEMVISDTGYVAYVNGDRNYHYSDASLKVYLKKLKFRVINNIFDVEGSGYSNKASQNLKLSRRKYLFPFYTISLILPFIDGIRMMINYKHWVFLLHPFFCIYVLVEIFYQYTCKLLGAEKKNNSYVK